MGKVIQSRRYTRLLVLASLFVIFALLLVFLVPSARANEAEGWSWSEEPVIVQYSRDVEAFYNAGICPSFYRYRDVSGAGEKDICITEGDKASFGIYYTTHGFPPVVSKGRSRTMFPLVNSVCSQRYDSCLYEPGADILVTKQYLVNSIVRSLVIYKNFSGRIEKRFNASKASYEFTFDSSNPDYIFESASGYAWPIGGVGFSENGRWLAVEFRERGFGLMDLDTMSMKRFTMSPSLRYGRGYDPTVELTVSDDGRYVAIMGMNAGFYLYENDSTCGDVATDERMQGKLPISRPCKNIAINTGVFIDRFHVGYQPRFFNGGAELRFYTESYTGARKDIALRPASVKSSGINYIALGDSYTSGEGDMDEDHYLAGTNTGVDRCHVSDRSYPFNLAARFEINPGSVKNVACSGAKVQDVVAPIKSYLGQEGRLVNGDAENTAKSEARKIMALSTFYPGLAPQAEFVSIYQPGLVTVGIGGNDLGMMEKLNSCAGPGTCEWAGDERVRYQTGQEIISLFSTLAETYRHLRDLSPLTTVAAVGYPQIINDSGSCGGVTGALFNRAERIFMAESIKLLNAVIKQAALRAGVAYVDVENSLMGNRLCDSGARTINEVSLNLAGAAFSKWVSLVGAESYHPNSLGHELIARYAFRSRPFLPYGMNGSPDASVLPPSLDGYWAIETNEELPEQIYLGRLGGDSGLERSGEKSVLHVDQYAFEEGSTIKVEVHSEPQLIGLFDVDASGGGSYEFSLPDNLSPGFHVLHMYGTSYDEGAPLDVYEFVKVAPADGDDESSVNQPSSKIVNTSDHIKRRQVANASAYSRAQVLAATDAEAKRRAPLLAAEAGQHTSSVRANIYAGWVVGGLLLCGGLAVALAVWLKRKL